MITTVVVVEEDEGFPKKRTLRRKESSSSWLISVGRLGGRLDDVRFWKGKIKIIFWKIGRRVPPPFNGVI